MCASSACRHSRRAATCAREIVESRRSNVGSTPPNLQPDERRQFNRCARGAPVGTPGVPRRAVTAVMEYLHVPARSAGATYEDRSASRSAAAAAVKPSAFPIASARPVPYVAPRTLRACRSMPRLQVVTPLLQVDTEAAGRDSAPADRHRGCRSGRHTAAERAAGVERCFWAGHRHSASQL